ncbi:putative nonribosomal peptide synthase [Aspergillus fischeri NRRL 181]|uniref:Nonribosomal peptide synthase, putative n=1 Tax=Neosartorya fischeri (strain ATCC 1020 / DSM 3700 / CBS 544.65 / FGSC A1164 / JCM 1740 / NRRL 181 / WB 181) TaxID=331117 RepID=A1CUX1_NEOFI|nr:nonribosomal peptide synthase, putative [Aspergillus fischeri NRRL 181]EAW25548.1 nonribosomal peptide synthase, putative [Aspergillus fischeri NRRL 181]KAG2001372.1 hypothetical protein GB937_010212 [Aspergillus fischeri]
MEQGPYDLMMAVLFGDSAIVPEKLTLLYRSTHLPSRLAPHISSTISQAMKQMMMYPKQCIKDIDLFSTLNQNQLRRWNRVQQSPTASVLELIHGHARADPDHLAIVAWDGTITYSQLELLTSQLASHLQTCGIGPECLVPIMADRSMWAVVGELAILKAGGAFVPIDPSQPVERVKSMMVQANAKIALSSPHLVGSLSSLVDTVIAISPDTMSRLPKPRCDAVYYACPDRTAYVLFTSGSTGQPKGCVAGLTALSDVVNQTAALKINSESRVLQFASYSFGMSLIEIYCTLAAGATICIPSKKDRLNNLSNAIKKMRITWALLTPSTAISLGGSVECLKTLVLAGEPMGIEHIQQLASRLELLQAFGFTEWAGICCVSQPIKSEADIRSIGVSPTASLWLADPTDCNKLAPVGAVAELLVEGPALVEGYLKDVPQTATAFIESPPWLRTLRPEKHVGVRIYKTGDLVQYQADGSIRYVARKSTQVKIRGMRVELGEVEYQIRQSSPQLEKVIVEAAAPAKSNGIPILVAFLYSANPAALTGQSLSHLLAMIRNRLEQTLPEYMRPAVYFPLHSVPVTITGKVDRRALRAFILISTRKDLETHQTPTSPTVAPNTNVEKVLHRLFAEVLNLDLSSFGIHERFIQLGGDSVTAMLLVNKCKKHSYRLTVATILREQTISKLALLIDQPTAIEGHFSPSMEMSLVKEPAAGLVEKIERNPVIDEYVPIASVPYSGPLEQSFSQGRLWFLEQLYPDSIWYLLPFATRVRGPLQLRALEIAVSALTERHETLRTVFEDCRGIGLQIVRPFTEKPLTVVDIPSGSEAGLRVALHQQQTTPFDLTREPGWRVAVFRMGPDDHVLSIVMHHIISDGWSVDILTKTLGIFYAAALRGEPPLARVEPLPIQYRDFSVWQRQEGQTVEHEMQLEYWVDQLDGSQPAEFLCDKQRPAMLSGVAGCQDVKIDGSLYQDLQRFCRSSQTTAFTVLLAAFRATHYRLTGVEDATVGIPIAGRNRPELEGLIGFFVNVQCIRIRVEDQSFQQLVRQVHTTTAAAFENQDVPFEKIVSKLQKDRDMSRHPLVQVTFVVHSQANFGEFSFEGLETRKLSLPQVSRLDLEFHLYRGQECLTGNILYSEDLFNPETIKVMLSVFYDVLLQGISQPDTQIGSLPLTDGYSALSEMGLIYPEPRDYHQEWNIVDLFQRQVAATPHQIAVKETFFQLTYNELDQRSTQVALWLTQQSFIKETAIGVLANRSCETIVALLGILKAGLAYVPLDPKLPIERMKTVLSCLPSGNLVLLGSGITVPPIPGRGCRFLHIADTFAGTIKKVNKSQTPLLPICPTSLAYILFTSGTTGKPKGVMVEHRGIVRLVKDANIINQSANSKAISHMLNPAFDASGLEIYTALLNGGTLICLDAQAVWDYAMLEQIFAKENIRIAFMTTAMLKQFLTHCPAIIGCLEILCLGGDRLDREDVAKARKLGEAKIINSYGPTENSVVSTMYCIPPDEEAINGVPIGRPIIDTGAYVMDPKLRLVPIGVMGELVVTGSGLARGYTNLELNAGRFLTVDIGGQVTRAYRTGDLVRYRPSDGQLEFFGRMDQQVKIRGHRVELAEIDNSLLTHRSVDSAVTVLQMLGDRDQELVSFVTVHDMHDLETGPKQPGTQSEVEQVDAWASLFDGDTYDSLASIQQHELGKDFRGWTSMYDGGEIDRMAMEEWLEDTVASIRSGSHVATSALEIGTGSGMVLFNLVHDFQQYMGLEPSAKAVQFIHESLRYVPEVAERVYLQQGTASDITSLGSPGPVDIAIVNSVAQYFPSARYLLETIKDLVQSQGVKYIFFGDIRSYALYREFQVSKALHQYGEGAKIDDIQHVMAETTHMEEELLLDPAFFTALPTQLPELIEHVEILPKRMKATNELSSYRYAAVLYAKNKATRPLRVHDVEESSWVDFSAASLDRQSLLELLSGNNQTLVLPVSNIPYSKINLERHIVDFLQEGTMKAGHHFWVQNIRQQAEDCPSLAAVDLIDLAQQMDWQVEISWARQHSQRGGLDAIFHRIQPDRKGARVLFRFPTDHQGRLMSTLSNNPLELRLCQKIEKELAMYLRARLPSYMVPKMIRVLDRMPINNNGKVDRLALARRTDIPALRRAIQTKLSFQNDIERALWEEFTDVLGVEVGITDSFFDCGGHSLMATKVVSRINHRLQSNIKISDLFARPTIACLSERVQELRVSNESSPSSTVQPFSLLYDNLSSTNSIALGELGLSPGTEVTDILPVTEAQAWFLTQWSRVSNFFVISGEVDIGRLRTACEAVVQRHAILRTLFTKLNGRLVQVVCRAVTSPFVHQHTDGDLGLACRLFCEDGDRTPLVPAKLLTRFALVSRSPREHLFVVQLSHAQYDGRSLGSILSDISSVYGVGSPSLPTAVPFTQYVHACVLCPSSDAISFWKEYLGGASLTILRPLTACVDAEPADITRAAAGELPTPPVGITIPTLVNAAIAFTLASLVNSDDITFGLVINSRDILDQAADSVVGPCVNRILVRTLLQPDCTVLNFCRKLRDETGRLAAYSQLSLQEVIDKCTSWPSSYASAPFVTHLPEDASPSFSLKRTNISYISTAVRLDPANHVFVRSSSVNNQLSIHVLSSSTLMDDKGISSLASQIVKTAQAFCNSPHECLGLMGL